MLPDALAGLFAFRGSVKVVLLLTSELYVDAAPYTEAYGPT